MSLLTISSENPKLSWVLAKNPETISSSGKPFHRKVRKGSLYGWFSPDQKTFRLWFKDSDLDMSFSQREFEYLDLTRYCSPQLPIAMMTEALATASKILQEEDKNFRTHVETTISMSPHLAKIIVESTGGEVLFHRLGDGNAHVVSILSDSVHKCLNLLQVICIMACVDDDEVWIPLGEEVIQKYIRALKASKAPYHLWHMFLVKAVTSTQLFEKLKPELNLDGVEFTYGNSQYQRYTTIREEMAGVTGRTLYNIGCGEMYYEQRLFNSYDAIVSYEMDEDLFLYGQKKIKRFKSDNITLIHKEIKADDILDFPLDQNCDILLTEVVEHMDREEALKLLVTVACSHAGRAFVTVPNHSFNQNYGLPTGTFRHDDHKWEPNLEYMEGVVESLQKMSDRKIELKSIGDIVNGQASTIMMVMGSKE